MSSCGPRFEPRSIGCHALTSVVAAFAASWRNKRAIRFPSLERKHEASKERLSGKASYFRISANKFFLASLIRATAIAKLSHFSKFEINAAAYCGFLLALL